MRKLVTAFLIFITLLSYAQGQNRFSEEENEAVTSSSERYSEPEQQVNDAQAAPCANQDVDCDCDGTLDVDEPDPENVCGEPNPADPIPINDYIPALILIAVGIIIYKTQRKKATF